MCDVHTARRHTENEFYAIHGTNAEMGYFFLACKYCERKSDINNNVKLNADDDGAELKHAI